MAIVISSVIGEGGVVTIRFDPLIGIFSVSALLSWESGKRQVDVS